MEEVSQSHTSLDEHPAQPAYCFELDDPDWLEHLRREGYCVVSGVASPYDVERAKSLLWEDFTACTGAVRGEPDTWQCWRSPESGLLAHLSQSAGAWAVRGLPGVRAAFERAWATSDLIVSMDAVIAWRPWRLNESWRPRTEGLHLDQNPFSKPGLDCIQGMMPLIDVTAATGGLEVIPRSHNDEAKAAYRERYPYMERRGDWCILDSTDPMQSQGLLLEARAGSLILWDSRTVHGGVVGTGEAPKGDTGEVDLARLTVTVAMTPRMLASEDVLKLRVQGFKARESFNHCPHEAGTSAGTIKRKLPKGCARVELNDAQLALL